MTVARPTLTTSVRTMVLRRTERVIRRLEFGDPFWPAQLAVAVAIALNLVLSEKLTIGPNWLVPSVSGVLLAVLVTVAPARATAHSRARRRFALAVIGIVSLANVVSLGLLVHYLVVGG